MCDCLLCFNFIGFMKYNAQAGMGIASYNLTDLDTEYRGLSWR